MHDTRPVPRAKLAGAFLAMGLVAILGTTALASRLIWEQTVLSWTKGPQMIGFSLAHGPGALLFFFPLILTGWLIIAIAYLTWKTWGEWRITPFSLGSVCAALLLMGILNLPEIFWERIFIGRFAQSPHASVFLVDAASRGNSSTLKALLARGVPIDSTGYDQKTALFGASDSGAAEIVAYLLSEGADVNKLSLAGDSPLEAAAANSHDEIVKLLVAHGAIRVRGTDEQRAAAYKASLAR